MAKRIMCIIISVLMIVSLLPTGVFAVENDSGESAPEVVLTSTADADSGGTTEGEELSDSDGEEATISLLASTSNGSNTQQDSSVVSVASNSSTKYYDTIEAGIEAASDKNRTITLLKDVTTESELRFINVTLDLNGNDLTCGAISEIYGEYDGDEMPSLLTIQNSSTTNTGTITCTNGITVGDYSTLKVTGDGEVVIIGTITVSGYDTTVEFTTGTFSSDVKAYCATGYTTVKDETTSYYKVVVDNKVAKIGETGYSSITEALSAASDGDTVTVIKAVSNEAVSYSGTGSVTLDLAGYALNLTSLSVTAGTLTITDSVGGSTASSLGTISATADNLKIIGGTYSDTSSLSTYVPYGYNISDSGTVSQTVATFTLASYNSEIVTLSSVTVSINGQTTIVQNFPYNHSCYVGDTIVVTATATVANPNSYTFKGWYYNTNGTGDAFATATESGEGSYTITDVSITLTGDTTIYAVCETNSETKASCDAWLSNATEEGVYTISSISDWQNFVYAVNTLGTDFTGKTVQLTTDLDFSSYANVINPVGTSSHPFKGTFDGQNYTISNMTYESNGLYAGVFGVVSGATIKNLNVTNSSFKVSSISSGYYAGGIVADAQNSSVIENCTVSNVTVEGWFSGGIAGHTYGATFNNVTATDVAFAAVAKSGCIVGYAESLTIDGATVTSSLTANSSGMPAAVVGQANGDETLNNLVVNASGLNVIGTMETASTYTVTIDGEETNITAAAIAGNYSGTNATLTVSAGTYSFDVSEYVAEGKDSVANTDGTYTVTTGVAGVYDADGICKAVYSSLADAFSAVQTGETIKLLGDLTVTNAEYSANGLYQVSTNVTLDLNSHTLTVNTTRVFGVLNGGSLTVKNGTVKIADNATATGNQFNILRGKCSFTAENVTFDGNNIAANFLHVAAGGTATISLTNCDITNQSGGVVVYDNDGNSTVTLTGCNYATNPSGGALNNIANFKIVFNSNNKITSSSDNWETSNALRYTYVVADGGSVEADLTLATTKGAASLTVEGGSVTGTITVPSGTSMTVSGGSVTGTITTSGTFTMTDGTVTASSGASQAVLVKGGTVNISGGKISASSSRALVFDTDVTVSGTISGGTFTGNDIALLARSSDGNTVSVTGGTYTATKGIDLVASILANGYGVFDTAGNAATVSGNYYSSTLSDNTVVISTGVAKVGEAVYGTIAAALSAASSTDTVTLVANTSEDVVIPSSKTITLDLNGYELTNVSDHTITVEIDATLTITDSSTDKTGKVDNLTHAKAAIYNNGTVTLNGGEYTRSNENGQSSSDNGGNSFYVVLNHGTMTINSGVKVTQNGAYSSMIENGYQSYTGTSANGSYVVGTNAQYPSLTINGGTFYGGLNTIKNDDGGYLVINDGTFTNVAQNAVMNWNVCEIKGGTFDSAYVVIWSNYSSGSEVDTGKLTISGGTFTGVSTYYIVYSVNTAETNISGGTYSVSDGGTVYITQSTSNYAENYAPTATTDGKYEVVSAVASVTSGTTVTSYATLDEALSAATNGSTVTLLANVEVKENLSAETSGTVTLDLAGNDLTINTGVTLTVASGTTVVIKDSVTTDGGLVTNNGTISVAGTLDIRDLGYTTSASGAGLLGQQSGQIALASTGIFIVPDSWATEWYQYLGEWTPNWTSATSASGIFSSVAQGATVYSYGKGWKCETAFESSDYDSSITYWKESGTYLVEYFKQSNGEVLDSSKWSYPVAVTDNTIFAGWYDSEGEVYSATSGVAYAKFVTLVGENGTAGVINYLGVGLSTAYNSSSNDYSTIAIRFGYDIVIPTGCDSGDNSYSWAWLYSVDDKTYYSAKGTNSTTDLGGTYTSYDGTTKFRSNLVIKNIPSSGYDTTIYSILTVTYKTADGTTVTAKDSTTRSSSVNYVVTAIGEIYSSGASNYEKAIYDGIQALSGSSESN